jgi:hypothetical protein
VFQATVRYLRKYTLLAAASLISHTNALFGTAFGTPERLPRSLLYFENPPSSLQFYPTFNSHAKLHHDERSRGSCNCYRRGKDKLRRRRSSCKYGVSCSTATQSKPAIDRCRPGVKRREAAGSGAQPEGSERIPYPPCT